MLDKPSTLVLSNSKERKRVLEKDGEKYKKVEEIGWVCVLGAAQSALGGVKGRNGPE